MTTWTWECLLDGKTGTASTHEDAIAAAQTHNAREQHDTPSISYSHDEPPPDPIPAQRTEAEHVRVANVTETDWIITPPPDTPADILNQINNNLPGWQTFRRELRALPIQTIPDPTDLVWPTHPIRPYTALTPQPPFVTGGGTP